MASANSAGIIRESSAITHHLPSLYQKKGEVGLVFDYRKMNEITVNECFLILNMKD